MFWSLFVAFFKIGLISFGGGYAMIPIIQHDVVDSHHWLSNEAFTNAVAVAGMAPGPIATNCATLIGYKTAGVTGGIAATVGIVLPSLLLIVLIASFFIKMHKSKWVRSSFYGLRPVVTGLIVYAAVRFGTAGQPIAGFSWQTAASLAIVALVVVGIIKFRLHPFAAIILSGLLGVVIFYP